MRIATISALGLGLAAFGPTSGPATAHPHVWIDNFTTFVFEDDRLVGLRHNWVFDAFFSSYVIEGLDQDGDRTLSEAEVQLLYQNDLSSLADYGYFTHLRVDGEPVAIEGIKDFEAWIEDDEILVYAFTALLPEPVDPGAADVRVGIFDPEYYVDVLLDEVDPVRFDGLPSGACAFRIREDTLNPIYYGMVYPLMIDLDCGMS